MADYLISQLDDDVQALRVDFAGRYIQNSSEDWQFLFNSNSVLTPKVLLLKHTGQFDTGDFNSIKLAAYLFNSYDGSIAAGASCTFNVYRVSVSGWTETLINTFTGVAQPNNYFYIDIPLSSLSPAELDGDNTLMVECVFTRLTDTYRDRVYLNHLGSFGSIIKLKNKVDFLEITKKSV